MSREAAAFIAAKLTADILDFTSRMEKGKLGRGDLSDDESDDEGMGEFDISESEEGEVGSDDGEDEEEGSDESEGEEDSGEGEIDLNEDEEGAAEIDEDEEWHGIAESDAESDSEPAPELEPQEEAPAPAPAPGRYVPPHLRAAQLAEKAAGDGAKAAERAKLERKAQGLLNK